MFVGELRHIHKLKNWPLESVLSDKYCIEKDPAGQLTSFLHPMLNVSPDQRATAKEMLGHEWLKGVIVMGELETQLLEQEDEAAKRDRMEQGKSAALRMTDEARQTVADHKRETSSAAKKSSSQQQQPTSKPGRVDLVLGQEKASAEEVLDFVISPTGAANAALIDPSQLDALRPVMSSSIESPTVPSVAALKNSGSSSISTSSTRSLGGVTGGYVAKGTPTGKAPASVAISGTMESSYGSVDRRSGSGSRTTLKAAAGINGSSSANSISKGGATATSGAGADGNPSIPQAPNRHHSSLQQEVA